MKITPKMREDAMLDIIKRREGTRLPKKNTKYVNHIVGNGFLPARL